eukprot:gene4099-5848_t
MSSLPSGWSQRESKSHGGKVYYINSYTGETTWTVPTAPAEPPSDEQVQVSHILKKHVGSRRPSSWRCETITISKDEAIAQITEFKEMLQSKLLSEGVDAAYQLFQQIAKVESDCSSAARGGDLGLFGRGQMQKSFENASYALKVGELSDLVDSDSGIHIIFRVR